jgi:hypothetical protein
MKILITETSVRSESGATWSRLAPTGSARPGEYFTRTNFTPIQADA